MTKDTKKLTPEEWVERVKEEASSLSDGIIVAEKKLRYLEMIGPKNVKERAALNLMRQSFGVMKGAAKETILNLMSAVKESGMKIKKEDLDKIQGCLALCEEEKKKKRVSRANVRIPFGKKQLTRE